MKHVEKNGFRLHNSLLCNAVVQRLWSSWLSSAFIAYDEGTNFSKCKFSGQNMKWATCFNLHELYFEWSHFFCLSSNNQSNSFKHSLMIFFLHSPLVLELDPI